MLVKTPQLVLTALAHVFWTEKLLVTDFLLFSVCVCMCVFIAKSGIPLNSCVSLKTSHVFNSTNSPLCGCQGDVFILQSGENGKQNASHPWVLLLEGKGIGPRKPLHHGFLACTGVKLSGLRTGQPPSMCCVDLDAPWVWSFRVTTQEVTLSLHRL